MLEDAGAEYAGPEYGARLLKDMIPGTLPVCVVAAGWEYGANGVMDITPAGIIPDWVVVGAGVVVVT